MVLVHNDANKSRTTSNRTRHTYRKYCTPGLAESFLESPVLYNSWKQHCSSVKNVTQATTSAGDAQNSAIITPRPTQNRKRRRGQETVNQVSKDTSYDHTQETISTVETSGSRSTPRTQNPSIPPLPPIVVSTAFNQAHWILDTSHPYLPYLPSGQPFQFYSFPSGSHVSTHSGHSPYPPVASFTSPEQSSRNQPSQDSSSVNFLPDV